MIQYQGNVTRQSPQLLMESLMAKGLTAATRLGHRPGLPVPDVEGFASFTYCRSCGRSICVDLEESRKEPYGSGTTEPCNRRNKRR